MGNKKSIKQDYELVSTFKLIAQAYQEISLMKINHVRTSVLASRDFLTSLSEVYLDVKSSYAHQLALHLQNRKNTKKNKTLIVLLSANTKLFGSIVRDTFDTFEKALKDDMDVMIIGKLGYEMYKEHFPQKQPLYFELSDTTYSVEDLKPIMFHILNYEKVIVYHGEYQTILHQGVSVSNITGQALFEEGSAPARQAEYQYYFEPSLETILTFFETQIFANLFKQTLDESQLARNASRVKAMEQTMNNLADEEKRLKILQRKINRKIENKKQIDRYAGTRLWTG